MRDIKFRAKDVNSGKWVYGDLVHNKKLTETGLENRVIPIVAGAHKRTADARIENAVRMMKSVYHKLDKRNRSKKKTDEQKS